MSQYKGYFVDDVESERNNYARILSQNTGLQVEPLGIKEVATLANDIISYSPDIVLLDFRLDSYLGSLDPVQGFKGSSLAQHLRDRIISASIEDDLPDFPMVLLSSESNISQLYKRDKTAHDLFDCYYSKEKFLNDEVREDIIKKLISLCEAYKKLNEIWKKEHIVIYLFSSNEDIQEVVSKQDIKYVLDQATAPHIVSRFILNFFIRREGILYSSHEIAAKLGIFEESLNQKIFDWLDNTRCKYTDIFSSGWQRWWAHRFEDALEELIGSRPFSMTASERVAIINEKLETQLTPAISQWNGKSDEKFIFACACCENPTEIRHSLSVFDPVIPRFVQKKRVCWGCIRDDKYQDKKIEIDEVDLRLAHKIQSGSI